MTSRVGGRFDLGFGEEGKKSGVLSRTRRHL